MMNRLNTISPSLKSKALEETEAVSRELVKRFYQAVCLDTPPETGVENRSIPTPPTPPAVLYKSPPTPTIPIDKLRNRANLRQSLSYHSLASTPSSTPEVSSRKTRNADRKVSFSNMASVILIPTVGEYVHAGLHHHLWWRSVELQEFRHNAHREIRSLMEIYGLKHIREAFNIMTRHELEESEDLVPANSHVNFPTQHASVTPHLGRVPFLRHGSRLADSLQALVAQQLSPQPSPEPSVTTQYGHC